MDVCIRSVHVCMYNYLALAMVSQSMAAVSKCRYVRSYMSFR